MDNEITAVYDRHSYDSEKRLALEAWGRQVVEIVTGASRQGEVVALLRRKDHRAKAKAAEAAARGPNTGKPR